MGALSDWYFLVVVTARGQENATTEGLVVLLPSTDSFRGSSVLVSLPVPSSLRLLLLSVWLPY